ncbi:hypothetical protein [Prauserella flavalba]|uniref:Uncharacterized protein n=1 Tax=Prauserella flavalba TaxID=1477506 RepID=A0A318LM49_9PSEU|nr:hypothetical protein [Prauserella flavalba]PXY35716.1 hypothetical protein BA062_09480 [Prauserella flavalba]
MTLRPVLRQLYRSESSLAAALRTLARRHAAEHEVHHVARDLARWSEEHLAELAATGERRGLRLGEAAPTGPHPLVARDDQLPGDGLLTDLRELHREIAGVSVDWELLAQGAQAARDSELLQFASRCHPRTLRQLRWSNAMLKVLSPQLLTS